MIREAWFYHLERTGVDDALPPLLDKTLQRGWRALVRVDDEALLERLDDRLWTWRDDAFLAHGRADRDHADRQPILLTEGRENPNGAQALFILGEAEVAADEEFERCLVLFDGGDDAALTGARERWRRLRGSGPELAYWRQDADGRWSRQQ